jgi:hypothetical protein
VLVDAVVVVEAVALVETVEVVDGAGLADSDLSGVWEPLAEVMWKTMTPPTTVATVPAIAATMIATTCCLDAVQTSCGRVRTFVRNRLNGVRLIARSFCAGSSVTASSVLGAATDATGTGVDVIAESAGAIVAGSVSLSSPSSVPR